MAKKTLITGGAGAIGYFLGKELAEQGQQITLVDNLTKGGLDSEMKELLKKPNVKLLKLDVTDPKQFRKIGSGYDFVYHLAAINGTKHFYNRPVEVLRVGVLGVFNILEWFKNQAKGKIIFTSSNEAYASWVNLHRGRPIPTPETIPLCIDNPANPRWSYGGGKLIGEILFFAYAKTHGFPMTIVRFHNSYGPRMGFDHVMPEFFLRILKRQDPFPIFGSNATRAFCYISDTIWATQLVMESKKTDNEIVHIGNDREEIKMLDLAKLMFRLFQWRPRKLEIQPAPPGSVIRRCPDLRKIKKLTGYKPRVSLEEGLRKTYGWYKENFSK